MKDKVPYCEYCDIEDFPSLSLVLPFDPKMNHEDQRKKLLKEEAEKIENEALQKYPENTVRPLIEKLHTIIQNLEYKPNKGIGIFISSVAEKVYFFSPVPDAFKKFPSVNKVLPDK